MLSKGLAVLGIFAVIIGLLWFPIGSYMDPTIKYGEAATHYLVLGVVLIITAMLLRKKPAQDDVQKFFAEPQPTSGDQIKPVYTPIEYVQAGEEELKKIKDRAR